MYKHGIDDESTQVLFGNNLLQRIIVFEGLKQLYSERDEDDESLSVVVLLFVGRVSDGMKIMR